MWRAELSLRDVSLTHAVFWRSAEDFFFYFIIFESAGRVGSTRLRQIKGLILKWPYAYALLCLFTFKNQV